MGNKERVTMVNGIPVEVSDDFSVEYIRRLERLVGKKAVRTSRAGFVGTEQWNSVSFQIGDAIKVVYLS